jgi:hypothetical protein
MLVMAGCPCNVRYYGQKVRAFRALVMIAIYALFLAASSLGSV